jgi:hypothetical protein
VTDQQLTRSRSSHYPIIIQTQSPSPKSVSQELFQTSTQEQASSTPLRYHEKKEEDNILRVDVESVTQTFTFNVPVSQVLLREREMREATKKAGVAKEQWSASRLYSLWKTERNQQDDVDITYSGASSQITVRLFPEDAMKDYSLFEWKPWLTSCIREFYKTGSICIPDDCLGSDLLIALEYLRIITISPKIFVFNSSHPYERIRAWSAYFTKRRTILDWLIRDYRYGGLEIRTYTTTPDSQEGSCDVLLQVKGEMVDILGKSKEDTRLLYKTVHSLFCENDSDQVITRQVPRKIRHDFRDQLLRFLPHKTKISFELHRVTVTKNGQTERQVRPVLRIEGPSNGEQKKQMASHIKATMTTSTDRPAIAVASPDPNQLPRKVQGQQQDTTEELRTHQKAAGLKPLSIVNMDQGSVTSALSLSMMMMDDSTMGTIMNDSPVDSSIKQPSHKTTFTSLKPSHNAVKKVPRSTRTSTKRESDGDSRTLSASDSTLSTRTYERRRQKANHDTPCDSFESLLFTVCDRGVAFCDQMIPTGQLPPSGRSRSPVHDDESTLLSFVFEDETALKARQANAASSPNKDIVAALSKDLTYLENAMNAAKIVGDSLYEQMDNVVFQALDPENSQQQLANFNTRIVQVDSSVNKSIRNTKDSMRLTDQNSVGGGSKDSLLDLSTASENFK